MTMPQVLYRLYLGLYYVQQIVDSLRTREWMTEYGRPGSGTAAVLTSSALFSPHKSFFRRRGRDWEHSSKLTSRLTY